MLLAMTAMLDLMWAKSAHDPLLQQALASRAALAQGHAKEYGTPQEREARYTLWREDVVKRFAITPEEGYMAATAAVARKHGEPVTTVRKHVSNPNKGRRGGRRRRPKT